MAVRRWFAVRTRQRSANVWPILPGSEKPPPGWPGWPEGKQFALVLTHDVEGQSGVDKCRRLMELEMKLGFRSSFNFIPEGTYRVPRELRVDLVRNGFEVGVHDLYHDGKLYQSKSAFCGHAARINRYLKDWNAVGFRAGFMLHKLDWLHDLNIQYDASTFDTDPFEPQPEGVGTIFPFWVPAPSAQKSEARSQESEGRHQKPGPHSTLGPVKCCPAMRAPKSAPETLITPHDSTIQRFNDSTDHSALSPLPLDTRHPSHTRGYVELPYTLVQDSTLFLLLREKSPEIWLRKLDWVVQHGGMALINVHPDYLRFPGEPASHGTFSAQLYSQLLEHARGKHGDRVWHALPRDVARLVSPQTHPDPASTPSLRAINVQRGAPAILKGKRVAVIVYSTYPADVRVRREAEALVKEGMEVDLLCVLENDAEASNEVIGGVNVRRVRIAHRRDSKLAYFWRYGVFLLYAFLFLAARNLRRRYRLVHVHNMPDVLVFSTLVPKLMGARVILDLHDPMPELMMTIYGLGPSHTFVRVLRLLERWSIGFADLAITPNVAFRDLFVSRSCGPDKMHIVMNSPEEAVFRPDREPWRDSEPVAGPKPFRIMHHGTLVHRHGIDVAVEAVALAPRRIPVITLTICGSRTPYLDSVLKLCKEKGLDDCVKFLGFKSQDEIAQFVAASDLGIVPNRRSPFTEINMPTRIFEYLAMGKPVIAPDTRGIRDYFDERNLIFFQPDNPNDLADKIFWVYEHRNEAVEIVRKGQAIYRGHLWAAERLRFVQMVAGLV